MAANTSLPVPTLAAEGLVKSFERHLKAENKRKATVDHYVGAVRQFLAFAEAANMPPVENLAREHVEEWLETLHQSYKPHSVKNRFVGLRIFFRWLLAEDEIKRDPTARIKMPAVDEVKKDVVSPQDVARVLNMLTKVGRHRDAVVIALLYDCGLRAGELADLRLVNVDLEAGVIFIERSKNRGTRAVGLSAEAVRYVDRYTRRHPRRTEYLVEGTRGKLHREAIYWLVRDAFAEAGVKAVIGPHDLRHTSASHVALAGGLTESQAMSIYGWTDPDMWRHYTRQVQGQAALEAHRRTSPLARLARGGK
jgi:site-specific recombinase XerD